MSLHSAMVVYSEGYDEGQGIRSATGSPLGKAVAGELKPAWASTGERGTWRLQKVESMESLENILHISAEASAGIGLFKASGRFDFAREVKFQSTSLFLAFSKTFMASYRQIEDPVLEPDAARLVSDNKLDVFTRRYGDRFVRGVRLGGEFFGCFRIETKDEESSKQIDQELKGSYGFFSADFKMKLTDTLKRHKAQASCFAYWEGGQVRSHPRSPEELFQAMEEWESTAHENPVPYFVMLSPYDAAKAPEPPNIEELFHQREVLQALARLRSQVYERVNLLEYMLDEDTKDQFVFQPSGGPDLAELHAKLAGDLDMISAAASWACDHPREAMYLETFACTETVQTVPGWKNSRYNPNYKLTLLPDNMPRRKTGITVVPTVPTVPEDNLRRRFPRETEQLGTWRSAVFMCLDALVAHIRAHYDDSVDVTRTGPPSTLRSNEEFWLLVQQFLELERDSTAVRVWLKERFPRLREYDIREDLLQERRKIISDCIKEVEDIYEKCGMSAPDFVNHPEESGKFIDAWLQQPA